MLFCGVCIFRENDMTHNDVWSAIDKLARKNKISCSKLAISSGLDATTFNKSKRYSVFGKPRWPSMHSISKILESTSTSPTEFAAFIEDNKQEH